MEELNEFVDEVAAVPFFAATDLLNMVLRFLFNTVVVWVMVHLLYYPKCKRRDYYFTFMLISVSIFFLIYLLAGVKLKMGFALGLFAIFSIIRYRTESMPVREMTYLFCIIAISVVNALATTISYAELLVTNLFFLIATLLLENFVLRERLHTKLIQYDRIALITPDKREELLADLRQRTGLDIVDVEVGALDFLRDMAMVKIHYRNGENGYNSVNDTIKISKEQWTQTDG